MSFLALIFQRTRWLQAPVALLSFILQRTPLLRLAATAEAMLTPSAGALVKSALTLAALGAYDTVAGATVISPSPASPASATVGVQFAAAFTITGANGSNAIPGSWSVLTTSLPPGLVLNGADSTGLLNTATRTVAILGTPTTAGSYAVKLTAWEKANKGAASQLITYTINVAAGANKAPAFTTHPSSQTVVAGTSVTFTTVVTGNPAPTLQWFRGTTLLTGKTSATLTLAGVTSADAGVYKLVATNSAAPAGVSSNLATLTVNTAPAFTSASSALFQALQSGQTFTVAATGNPAPTFAAVGLPVWATLNPTTGVISGTPATAQAGTTVVTLSATNGVAPAASQSFSLVVKTAVRLWQEANFTAPELANPAISGPTAVLAPDGLPNLVHYALGYGPRQTVPPTTLTFTRGVSDWGLNYSRPSTILGVGYSVETSPDLTTWSTTGVTLQKTSSAGGTDTWRGAVAAGPARVFLRLKVTAQ